MLCDNKAQCIPNEKWCNGQTDCQDGSDELDSCFAYECPPDSWECADGKQCIGALDVCDQHREYDVEIFGFFKHGNKLDCNDRSDESIELCGCSKSEWPCQDRALCLPLQKVCDSKADCKDKSDEKALFCRSWTCAEGYVKCTDTNATCAIWCDGKDECMDRSDEADCLNYKCPGGFRKCANNLQCIHEWQVCDDWIHCKDGSDELCDSKCLGYTLKQKTIVKRCNEDTTKCVPIEKYCDRVADCPLGSDETESGCNCLDWELHGCQLNGLGMCIYPEWIKYMSGHDLLCNLPIDKGIRDSKVVKPSGNNMYQFHWQREPVAIGWGTEYGEWFTLLTRYFRDNFTRYSVKILDSLTLYLVLLCVSIWQRTDQHSNKLQQIGEQISMMYKYS